MVSLKGAASEAPYPIRHCINEIAEAFEASGEDAARLRAALPGRWRD